MLVCERMKKKDDARENHPFLIFIVQALKPLSEQRLPSLSVHRFVPVWHLHHHIPFCGVQDTFKAQNTFYRIGVAVNGVSFVDSFI